MDDRSDGLSHHERTLLLVVTVTSCSLTALFWSCACFFRIFGESFIHFKKIYIYLDENNIRNSWDGNHNFVLMVFCLVPILIPDYTYGFVIYIHQLYLNLHSSLNFWVFKSLLFIYLFILGRVQHIFLIALLRFIPHRITCAASVYRFRLGRKEMFYLTTHSTHFIYGYMASYIW